MGTSGSSICDEWMALGRGSAGADRGGLRALVEHLVPKGRRHGAAIHLGTAV